jgi:hypothetical protein
VYVRITVLQPANEKVFTCQRYCILLKVDGLGRGPRRSTFDLRPLAKAIVFNTHSWDLWTQMWHAQLADPDRTTLEEHTDLWLPPIE